MRTSDTIGSVVLGVTPGWAACGWALVRITPDGDGVVQAGVIRTRSAYRTAEDTAADLVRRGRVLAGQLRVVAQREPIAGIVRLVGVEAHDLDHRTYGVLDTLSDELDVPTFEERHIARPEPIVERRCGLERLVDLLDDDEVPVVQRRRAIEAVALVLTVSDVEPRLIEARGLVRRTAWAGGKT